MTGKTRHAFCGLHRIAYSLDFDPTCPQCTLAHIAGQTQYDFDELKQVPLDDHGTLLNARTLLPAA
jgi:hypothetical protein